jgi:hypothetical protein
MTRREKTDTRKESSKAIGGQDCNTITIKYVKVIKEIIRFD